MAEIWQGPFSKTVQQIGPLSNCAAALKRFVRSQNKMAQCQVVSGYCPNIIHYVSPRIYLSCGNQQLRKPHRHQVFYLPATSSFSRLHYAIQYSFGWMSANNHEFLFMEPSNAPEALLCIGNRRRPHDTCAHRAWEENAFLCGVWGHFATGMLKKRLTRNEKVAPLEYCYECEEG